MGNNAGLLGRCDFKQYEHCGSHEHIPSIGQRLPPFGCANWKPDSLASDTQAAPPERIWLHQQMSNERMAAVVAVSFTPEAGGISYTRTSTADALAEALRQISEMYHADTCSFMLVAEAHCNCHVSAACDALARLEKGES